MTNQAKGILRTTVLLTISILLADGSASSQNEDDVISVDASIVVLNVAITDANGKAVLGLNQKQFKIFEDGIEQEIQSFESATTPFAAVILLDTSGSMEERVALARSAAIQFLDGLRTTDEAAIFNFDSKVQLVQDFSNSRDLREQAFDLKANGMTALNDAIVMASKKLSTRDEKRRAIVLLSDGADTVSKTSSDKAMKAALAAGATVYTIDMSAIDTPGKERIQNQAVLKNFAEKSGGRFIAVPGGIAMRNAFKQIVAELGEQYTVAYSPTNAKKDGKWRSIVVDVARPYLSIRTRKGYNGPKAK